MNKCVRSCKKIDEYGSEDLADLLSTGDEDTREVIKGLWENDKRNVQREFQRDQRANGMLCSMLLVNFKLLSKEYKDRHEL